MRVDPRPTPAERAAERIEVEVDEAMTVLAATLEDWAAPRPEWELQLREGHDSGRANNVEARLLYASGEQTSSLTFRLEQLETADDTGQQLVLTFEEADGIARLARLDANGLHVELFHVLTYT
ncbi:MAG TPA: hypothetical protein VFJ77_09570 [Gaiellaceae bacterium]|nr:hypothetical protein [Gaiellaceae bacterium]